MRTGAGREEGKVLAFDTETRLLAVEVAERHAAELAGASAWSRPDLFGFGCGVALDLETRVFYRYRQGGARAMVAHLEEADITVGYNSDAFDLGVLSAYADVDTLRARHVDLNLLVMAALDALPIERKGAGRIRQGGLDGLARANGLSGKTGHATDVPGLLRAGRVEEVLSYCAEDVRIVADLYRLAVRDRKLCVDGYLKKGKERVELGRLEVPIDVSAPGTKTVPG